MATTLHTPTRTQVEAVNQVIKNLGFMQKAVNTNLLKKLPSTLQADELPERMLGGIRNGMSEDKLLIATNIRLMLVNKPFMSFSGKLKVKDVPWVKVTAVEWKSGILAHHLIIRHGRRKWDLEIPGIHGKGRGMEMSEFLNAKLTPSPQFEAPSFMQQLEAKVRREGISGGEWKQLPDILQKGEMPEVLASGEYDDRNGLQVSKWENHLGLLVATDRRLLFIVKPPIGFRKVFEFAYSDIDSAKLKKGIMMGALTAQVNGRTEIFRAPNPQIEQIARLVEGRVTHCSRR